VKLKHLRIVLLILLRVAVVFGVIALIVFLLWGVLYLILY
jgi:hypothetical protein